MLNRDDFKANWNVLKTKVKEKWNKLTDDDLARINGERDKLITALQNKYGFDRMGAEKELDALEHACCSVEKEGKKHKCC